ncbi:MAG: acetyltransferase [Solirubrobacterales bacterium]|nr:acetyltransferase [Solirubrobacterales bacterium]
MAVTLRDARRGDELAVAGVHVRSWQEAYRELMPAEFLAELDPRDRAGRYEFEGGTGAPTTVVAVARVDDGGEVGDGDDPSLTNSGEVRSGSSPSPVDRAPEGPREPVIGFVTFGPSRDEDTVGMGEIYALYVDPGRYEGGVGRLLMAHARRRLKEQGFKAAVLWVLQGNERAASFYEREGWKPDGAIREEDPYEIVSHVRRFHLEELD